MMQIVHCDECDGTTIALDAVSVHVELSKSHHCDKCWNTKTTTTRYFFCSQSCFLEYIMKVAKDKATFDFDRYNRVAFGTKAKKK